MDKFEGYSFSWTQPYSVSMNPFYSKPSVADEMARLEMVDKWVDAMLTFPDAEAIMNKIRQQGQDNV
jgi:mono/diheme cytochrome c family protein